MDAGHQEGTLLTVRLNLEGRRMFVNADASGGQIRAEILGPTDTFSLDRSVPVRGDHLKAELKWKGHPTGPPWKESRSGSVFTCAKRASTPSGPNRRKP